MKDVYTLLNEALTKLDAAGKRKQFNERSENLTSVEAKINCANFVLGIKESGAPILKKNGRFSESITEAGGSENLSEAEQHRAKSDALMYKAMGISEADQRRLRNLPPVVMTGTQLREFRMLRAYRINEADAVRLALKVA